MNRRTRAALEDGSYWSYDYNDRNELTGARRYWPDQSPIAGQHFGYAYDNVGNRQSARSGGDTNGWNLRETSYTANNLNQYTSITTPGYEDILGVALANQYIYGSRHGTALLRAGIIGMLLGGGGGYAGEADDSMLDAVLAFAVCSGIWRRYSK